MVIGASSWLCALDAVVSCDIVIIRIVSTKSVLVHRDARNCSDGNRFEVIAADCVLLLVFAPSVFLLLDVLHLPFLDRVVCVFFKVTNQFVGGFV